MALLRSYPRNEDCVRGLITRPSTRGVDGLCCRSPEMDKPHIHDGADRMAGRVDDTQVPGIYSAACRPPGMWRMMWSRSHRSIQLHIEGLIGLLERDHHANAKSTSFHGISCSANAVARRPGCAWPPPGPKASAVTWGAWDPSATSWSSSTPHNSRSSTIPAGSPCIVEQLAVEQVQPGVEQPAAMPHGGKFVGAHWPAPVTIISGIAASDAARMMTRYTMASHVHHLPVASRRPCTESRWRRSGSVGRSAAARSPRRPPSIR